MNPAITTEELLALTKSADLLRQTAEKAMRCDPLARELHNTRNDRDHLAGILEKVARACYGDDPLDFPQLPEKVAELAKQAEQGQSWRDEFVKAENKANRAEERANSAGLQVIALGQRVNDLLRENETLARNMPPEPPADAPAPGRRPVFPPDLVAPMVLGHGCPRTQPIQTTKVIGQQWCRANRPASIPDDCVMDRHHGGWVVLCNVHQDVQTGALTYHPVAAKDLPLVP